MSKLALTDGRKAVTFDRSRVSVPLVREAEIQAVVDLMRKGEISVSPLVEEFEAEFAEYIGCEYGLASNSGTSSLHQGLAGVGVPPGGEVIVPSFTFGPGAATILAARGVPVFCDVERETHNIDPDAIRRKITPRTHAIMVVHVWGNPCDMGPIMELAREHGLAVVEDCSHAHGATWHGQKIGSIGDVGCFSLQGSKLVKAGEGGMLTTSSREVYERAAAVGRTEKIRNFPPDSPFHQCPPLGFGFKYRPHPLGMALAREQLRDLDERNEIRDQQGSRLDAALAEMPGVIPQKVLPGCRRVYAYHYAGYDADELGGVSTEVFLGALKAEGVSCGRIGYGRLHDVPLFVEGSPYQEGCLGKCPHVKATPELVSGSLPVTEHLRTESFSVAPRFEVECPELVDQYIEAYHKVTSAADELREYEKAQGGDVEAGPVSGRSMNPV